MHSGVRRFIADCASSNVGRFVFVSYLIYLVIYLPSMIGYAYGHIPYMTYVSLLRRARTVRVSELAADRIDSQLEAHFSMARKQDHGRSCSGVYCAPLVGIWPHLRTDRETNHRRHSERV